MEDDKGSVVLAQQAVERHKKKENSVEESHDLGTTL